MKNNNLIIKITTGNKCCNVDNFEDYIDLKKKREMEEKEKEFLLIIDKKTKRRFFIELTELK